MRRTILLLPLLLAACNSGDVELRNVSLEEVAAKTKDIERREPGSWETKSELTALDLGAVDGGPMAKMMRDQVGKSTVDTTCLTPKEATAPAFGKAPQGSGCRFDKFSMAGGKLDALMRCSGGETPGVMLVTQTGSYSSTSYDLVSKVTRTGPDGKPAGGVTMRITGKRTGACKA